MSSRRSARLSGSSDNTNDSPEPPRVLSTSTRQPGKVSGAKRKSLHDEEDNTNLNGKGKGRSTAAAVPEKVVKKSKKDTTTRPLNGEKLPGGLVIMRTAAPPRTTGAPSSSSQMPPPPPPTRQSPSPPRSSKPKASSSKVGSSSLQAGQRAAKEKFGLGNKSKGKAKSRNIDIPELPEIDEDVRAMQGELSELTLREQQDIAHIKKAGHSSTSISWPRRQNPRNSLSGSDTSGDVFSLDRRTMDSTYPIPIHDTPLIEKNKVMRRDAVERRRTSLGMRGRRASGSLTGSSAIAPPHPSVAAKTFYKHISSEIPEPMRARHLLYWCLSRCQNPSEDATPAPPQPPLPKLKPSQETILKDVQDEVLRQLAMGNIDTSIWSNKDEGAEKHRGKKKLKEHEQNVKNRIREKEWGKAIERCQAEDAAWSELIQSYNAYQASVVSAITSKAKKEAKDGPSRAWMSEFDSPWKGAIDLASREARDLDAGSSDGDGELVLRLGEVEHQVDTLHALSHTTSQMTHRTESHLSKFFSSLSNALSSQPSTSHHGVLSDQTSSLVPAVQTASSSSDEALDLLRALSRLPPPSTSGSSNAGPSDAALRAARDIRDGAERRLTAVPPTPSRRQPGTPRRPSTPGKKG